MSKNKMESTILGSFIIASSQNRSQALFLASPHAACPSRLGAKVLPKPAPCYSGVLVDIKQELILGLWFLHTDVLVIVVILRRCHEIGEPKLADG